MFALGSRVDSPLPLIPAFFSKLMLFRKRIFSNFLHNFWMREANLKNDRLKFKSAFPLSNGEKFRLIKFSVFLQSQSKLVYSFWNTRYLWCFWDPTWNSCTWKKVPWPAEHSVTLFVQVPPPDSYTFLKFYISFYSR